MIFTKEVMNNPDVKRYSEVKIDGDLVTIEDIDLAKNWLFAMLSFALEQEHNKRWLEAFLEKQDRKQFAPSQIPEE